MSTRIEDKKLVEDAQKAELGDAGNAVLTDQMTNILRKHVGLNMKICLGHCS